MKKLIFFLFLFSLGALSAQDILNPKFEKRLSKLLDHDVSELSVVDLYERGTSNYLLIDTREREEYDISHLPGARYVGYKKFSLESLSEVDKETPIVVYCSVGYRSEKITKQLVKAGYTNVHNLLGSIFEWANRNYPMVDQHNNETKRLHTYNKKWSQWVDHPDVEKVW